MANTLTVNIVPIFRRRVGDQGTPIVDVPSVGIQDGSATLFRFNEAPHKTSSVAISKNGILLTITTDYTINSADAGLYVFVAPPVAADIIMLTGEKYRYKDAEAESCISNAIDFLFGKWDVVTTASTGDLGVELTTKQIYIVAVAAHCDILRKALGAASIDAIIYKDTSASINTERRPASILKALEECKKDLAQELADIDVELGAFPKPLPTDKRLTRQEVL